MSLTGHRRKGIMLIEEGVLGRGGRITTSEIRTILLITHKLNSIIVLHYDFLVSLLILDCKTVLIFAYSCTLEESNKRCGTRLKTESETGERR